MTDRKMRKVDLCVIQDTDAAQVLLGRRRRPVVRTVIIIDQTVPPNSPEVSKLHKELMETAELNQIPLYYGRGMSAFLLCEKLVQSGQVVVGCDPSIGAAGAVGAWGFCVDTDTLARVLDSGEMAVEEWPEQRIVMERTPGEDAQAKRLALDMIRQLGESRLRGRILRICGNGADQLSLCQRIAICATLAKAGAAAAGFYGYDTPAADNGFCGEYTQAAKSAARMPDQTAAVPLAVLPGSYKTVRMTAEIPRIRVNGVFIGGTTGGSLEDMELTASMVRGRKIAYGLRLVVSPATAGIYQEAATLGYIRDIMEAGGVVVNQCGSPEVQGRIGKNEVMVSNDLENRTGYAGFETSRTYITDTESAVEAALTGSFGLQAEARGEERAEHRSLTFEGRCWKFGDDIDTDIIIPTQHLNYETMDEIKIHAFEPLRPELAAQFKSGDLIVAGSNFGCGSSREQAAEVIAANGVRCIIAKSFARIFFRNAINNGILLLECEELPDEVQEGDRIKVELDQQQITANGKTYHTPAIPANLYDIIMDGGLVKSVMKKVRNNQL